MTVRLFARTIDGPMPDRLIPVEEITDTIDLPWSTTVPVDMGGRFVEQMPARRGAHVYQLVERQHGIAVEPWADEPVEQGTYRYIGERVSERGDLIPATMTPVSEPGLDATVERFTIEIAPAAVVECWNCRAHLTARDGSCPACGVAATITDERMRQIDDWLAMKLADNPRPSAPVVLVRELRGEVDRLRKAAADAEQERRDDALEERTRGDI